MKKPWRGALVKSPRQAWSLSRTSQKAQDTEGRCAQMTLGPRGSNLLAEAPDFTEDRQAVFSVAEVWAHRIKERNKMVVEHQEVSERFLTQR